MSLTLLASAALLLTPAAPPPTSYCSPTGDYCIAVKRRGGAVFLELATFSFRGRYRLCVTDPTGRCACRSFRLRRGGDLYLSRIRWHTSFPRRGPGVYRVRWQYTSAQVGPTLSFGVR
jgi:hypothetical protein